MKSSKYSSIMIISPESLIDGRIIAKGDIEILGRVQILEGNSTNNLLVVESGGNIIIHGEVVGDVKCVKSISISGKLIGNIVSAKEVLISPTGVVTGNICTNRFKIADGGHFKGNLEISDDINDIDK
ncbi:polymer-forming cytoskeletal protein [Anoxybacterium hadale]|uniref:Polymer-forming cytoskeletal protein n=1 Tax=Anoxybacterium hadale TaxID=3408580 RepID=A0ACD1A8F9_9FIRM|nr:polymer-forming cytoskeletal protein [Clostridiales bacterium]